MRGWWRRVLELSQPRRLERETVEELQHHIDLLMERHMAAGLDADTARHRALAEAGPLQAARQRVAEERTGVTLDQLGREIRYAARVLRRSPGLTWLSAVTMAAGIGAGTVLFALVDGIVLRPLPYPQPDRLVRIFDTNPQAGLDRAGAAGGNISLWRERTRAFQGIAGYYAMGRTLSLADGAEAVITAQVSEDFFAVMGVAPALGRTFSAEETRRATFNSAAAPTGADPVAILSHGLWQRGFGGDPGVIGQAITLERRPFRVVGVMPAGFAMPDAGVQVWIPWHLSSNGPRDQHYLGAVGRLAPGLSLAQAGEQLNAVAEALGTEFPGTNRGWGVVLSPLATETVGAAAGVLWTLLAAVGVVLVVACANVALLTLMRGVDRQEETAVRLALGASAGRLQREFLMESVLLSTLGGTLGAATAGAALAVLPSITTALPRLDEVGFDLRVFGFVAGATLATAVLSGLPQAWQRARVAPLAGLAGTRRTTSGAGSHRLRDTIVVAQVAAAVILVMAAGLLVRTFQELRATDPGFDPRGVLVAPVFLDNQHYTTGARTRAYYATLFERLAAIPGVEAVGGATTVPTSPLGPDFERPVWPEWRATDPAERLQAAVRMITPGYIPAMGLRVVDGRGIDVRDAPDAPRVVMVSEALAARLWPGERAVGRQLVVDYASAGTYPYEIIGVIGGTRFRGPRSAPLPEIYLPHAQRSYLIMNVVVKASGDPRALVPAVRAALREVDPLIPAQGLYPLEELLGSTYARERQAMLILVAFAGAAIFLAVLSVYGVLSQRVRERAREIGIRMALGADTGVVVRWVAASGLRLVGAGLALGAAAAYAMRGTLEGVLFGVAATDPATAAVGLAALAGVGLVATVVPSWRATRIDPVAVLRRG